MTGKYIALEDYLRGLPLIQREVKLSFENIEGILKSRLPSSAYEDERWWEHETEANHVSTRAWFNAGWKIVGLNVKEKWVKLERIS